MEHIDSFPESGITLPRSELCGEQCRGYSSPARCRQRFPSRRPSQPRLPRRAPGAGRVRAGTGGCLPGTDRPEIFRGVGAYVECVPAGGSDGRLLTLSVPEMVALVGGLRALNANTAASTNRVFTTRPGTLSGTSGLKQRICMKGTPARPASSDGPRPHVAHCADQMKAQAPAGL